jgi:hypothetical protein
VSAILAEIISKTPGAITSEPDLIFLASVDRLDSNEGVFSKGDVM